MRSRKARQRARQASGRKGQFSEKEKHHALELYVAGMSRAAVSKAIGCSVESVRIWHRKAEAEGTLPNAPRGKKKEVQKRPKLQDRTLDLEVGSENETEAGTAMIAVPASPTVASLYTPHDNGQGLGKHEEQAILDYRPTCCRPSRITQPTPGQGRRSPRHHLHTARLPSRCEGRHQSHRGSWVHRRR